MRSDPGPIERDQPLRIIPPQLLLHAYRNGLFPMAHDDGELYWHDPDPRAIFPLNELEPDKKTRQQLRSDRIEITTDRDFEFVIRACADREETWIDERIIQSYLELHRLGSAHSIEVWIEERIVGGIYGVSIGKAFFGESMFNTVANMGKVAFHALVDLLTKNGYKLFDTQYINEFTAKLGAIEISRKEYQQRLAEALKHGDQSSFRVT